MLDLLFAARIYLNFLIKIIMSYINNKNKTLIPDKLSKRLFFLLVLDSLSFICTSNLFPLDYSPSLISFNDTNVPTTAYLSLLRPITIDGPTLTHACAFIDSLS